MDNTIASTKLGQSDRRLSAYPYYAGFTEAFANSALRHLNVTADDVVLDPWNGSGTTTSACARLGFVSIGIDVNPFMSIAAQVRSMHHDNIESSSAAVRKAIEARQNESRDVETLIYLANEYKIIREENEKSIDYTVIDTVSKFILARAARALLKEHVSRNPTWFRQNNMSLSRQPTDLIKDVIFGVIEELLIWARANSAGLNHLVAPTHLTADLATCRRLPMSPTKIISSPPYLTRIDYVKKTLPELLFLAQTAPLDINALRKMMLGTVVTRETDDIIDLNSILRYFSVRDALKRITNHSSKASSTYYRRFYSLYFTKLHQSLGRISDLSPNVDKICFVTQGSYYKENFINLPEIISEMVCSRGFSQVGSFEFSGRNHMAAINQRTFAAKQEPTPEVVSIFKRLQ